MRKTSRTLLVSVLVLASVAGLAACGGDASTKEGTVAAATADSIIIDVRTAEEFGAGHVEGALNKDLNNGDFQAALAGLDKNANYVLYCRSGNRSGQAMALMQQAGFEHVTNLGALEDAAAALNKNIVQ